MGEKHGGPALREYGELWGCDFTTVPGGSGSTARTVATATGVTKYGQRAATQAECDTIAGALDIVEGLMNDPANSKYVVGRSMVESGLYHVGDAMGCVLGSA